MTVQSVSFLGPVGTYSHQVARKRFGDRRQVPFASILDVCTFAAAGRGRRAIVPIENSTRGSIDKTVDILVHDELGLQIEEELAMEVRLALLGRAGVAPRVVYSHYAPLEHCDAWLRKHLPGVEKRETSSTAAAAIAAASEPEAVAIGSRRLASLYGLDVLVDPVAPDVRNVTLFFVLGRNVTPAPRARKTTLVVRLADEVGSLCSFLEPFRDRGVNLSRLVSRPITGKLKKYAFFVDIDGTPRLRPVREALAAAERVCESLRIVGAYPCRAPYRS